jgi:glycerophosphoryl diester phosphodiesterase
MRWGCSRTNWTINDPLEARRLVDLGADGVMTDDPRLIAPALGLTSPTPPEGDVRT